ncbi:MAG: DUF5399 family protein [Simkaniaceae bacterium]|nr:DUF5399 family protein [Simkaniaceae bacterium]
MSERSGPTTVYNVDPNEHLKWMKAQDSEVIPGGLGKSQQVSVQVQLDSVNQRLSALNKLFQIDVRNQTYGLFEPPSLFDVQGGRIFSRTHVVPSVIKGVDQAEVLLEKLHNHSGHIAENLELLFGPNKAEELVAKLLEMLMELDKMLETIQNEMKRYQKG